MQPTGSHPRHSRAGTWLWVIAIAAGLCTAASAHPGVRERAESLVDRLAQPIRFDQVDEPLLSAAIFMVTNRRRAEEGLSPLRHDPLLGQMASRHAHRMAALDFYSHDDPYDAALATPDDRARAVGIANPHVAENIHDLRAIRGDGGPVYTRGQGLFSTAPEGPVLPPHTYWSFARAVVDEWMASPAHRANILDRDARELGVGVAFYWRDGGWPFVKAVEDFQFFAPVDAAAAAD